MSRGAGEVSAKESVGFEFWEGWREGGGDGECGELSASSAILPHPSPAPPSLCQALSSCPPASVRPRTPHKRAARTEAARENIAGSCKGEREANGPTRVSLCATHALQARAWARAKDTCAGNGPLLVFKPGVPTLQRFPPTRKPAEPLLCVSRQTLVPSPRGALRNFRPATYGDYSWPDGELAGKVQCAGGCPPASFCISFVVAPLFFSGLLFFLTLASQALQHARTGRKMAAHALLGKMKELKNKGMCQGAAVGEAVNAKGGAERV